MRASPWSASWASGRFAKPYAVNVEDPFDATDNCARTLSPFKAQGICGLFTASAKVLRHLDTAEGALTLMSLSAMEAS